jgi:hypothetical protein
MRKTIDDEIMGMYAELISSVLPDGYGLTLLCFRLNDENSVCHYISTAQRKDMITTMKKMLSQLETTL